jgi:hypothetical protein
MHVRHKTAVLSTVLGFMLALPFPAHAQVTATETIQAAHETSPSSQSLAVGKLGRQQGRYALLDDQGKLIAYLLPRRSIPIDKFMGKLVVVTVSESTGQTNRHPRLWVDHIEHLTTQRPRPVQTAVYHREDSPQSTILAQYCEPVQQSYSAAPVMLDPYATCPQNAYVVSDYSAGGTDISCGSDDLLWVDVQYLLWWTSGMSIPPLVTTSPEGTLPEDAGVLGEPNTQILYGNEDILTSALHGARIRSGIWIDQNNMLGIQGEYFGFGTQSTRFSGQSDADGLPILARPFFNINPRDPFTLIPNPPARQDSQLVSFPDVLSGSIAIDANTQFQSASLAIRTNLAGDTLGSNPRTQYSRVDMIAGYRYLRLRDRLGISQNSTSLNPLAPVSLDIFDRFDTRNEFHGADLGAVWQAGWNRWSLECLLRTGIGNVRQVVDIQGGTTITPENAPAESYVGGLLAQQTNIGHTSQDRFAMLPEIGVTLGFRVLPHWQLTAGYTLLYWGSIARPGDQIDLDVNPDQLPPPLDPVEGPLRPAFEFHESDFWAQGMNIGLQGSW